MDNAHIVSGYVLLAAELLAVAVFALRVRSTPGTAVDASGVSIDELRTTLVSVAGSKEATTSPSWTPAISRSLI